MIIYPGFLGILPALFLVGGVLSLAESDLLWPSSSEDGINNIFDGSDFSSELSLNNNEETPLALGLSEQSPVLSLDDLSLLSSSLGDESNYNSLFENAKINNVDLFLSENNSGPSDLLGFDDQSFELADCSSSSSSSSIFSPINGKFRKVRQLDGSSPRSCQNSDSTIPGGDGSGSFSPARKQEPFEIRAGLERSWEKNAAREELKHNSACRDLTFNILPWGACSNPDPRYITQASMLVPFPWLGGIQLWYLDYCTAGMYILSDTIKKIPHKRN